MPQMVLGAIWSVYVSVETRPDTRGLSRVFLSLYTRDLSRFLTLSLLTRLVTRIPISFYTGLVTLSYSLSLFTRLVTHIPIFFYTVLFMLSYSLLTHEACFPFYSATLFTLRIRGCHNYYFLYIYTKSVSA